MNTAAAGQQDGGDSFEALASAAISELGGTGGAGAAGGADPGDPAAAAQPPEPPLPEFEAPHYWDSGAKQAWKALHGYQEGRPHLEALYQQQRKTSEFIGRMQGDYDRYKRSNEPIQQFLTPYVQQWAQDGLDPVSGLRQIMSFRDGLLNDPQGTLLALADRFGVDLNQAHADQEYVDPRVQALERQLREFREEREAQTRTQSQSQQQAVYSAIQQFELAQNQDGSLKYPHFARPGVLEDMLHLYATGRAQNPESAYEMAVRFNPDLQAELTKQAEQAAIAKAKAEQQAAEQLQARSGVRRAGTDRGGGSEMSLEEAARAALRG